MGELVVLKLGGSVITRKSEGKLEVDGKTLARLSAEVAEAVKDGGLRLVVVHGAGPFGHVPAKEYGLSEGLSSERQLKGAALTHQSMEELNSHVVAALQGEGVPAIALQPSASGIMKNGVLASFAVDVVREMAGRGLVPVAYGDVLVDLESGVSILSGDYLAPYLARKLKASRVVVATDVDGIFESDPKDGGKPKKIGAITKDSIDGIKLGGSRGTDVTGGMKRKVMELLGLAEEGISVQVLSALKEGETAKALLGESTAGTFIK